MGRAIPRTRVLYSSQEERLREAERLAGIGSWEWAPGSEVITWSEGLHVILNRPVAAGAPAFSELPSFYTASSWQRLSTAIEAAVGRSEPYELELEMIRQDGSPCWVLTRGEAIVDERGRVELLRGTVLNIDDRKSAENERLRAQQLESIGLLAGGIAHDFNNLLMVIRGNVARARAALQAGDDPRDALDRANRACDRAGDLTRQLLTFSRGGAPIRDVTSISELIRETVEFALRGAQLNCVLHIPDEPLPANVDGGQISQVINNIVLNAIQASAGPGTIVVRAQHVEIPPGNDLGLVPGDYVRIAFEDDGPGMSAEVQGRIFEPYFSTKETGTGLGLATSYSIVKRHRGTITAESIPGAGSRFLVYLPSGRHPGFQTPPIRPPRARPERSGTILLMDDDEDVLEVASSMVRSLGLTPDLTRDGAEAVVRYRERYDAGDPYDLVILDLTVPGGMGGKRAAREIVAIDPEARCVVMSGYSEDAVMADHRAHHFLGRLQKPFTTRHLDAILAEVLGEAS